MDGLLESLKSKEKNYTCRDILSKLVESNYADARALSALESQNLNLLKENGFAVTTAQQPCLFLGPLYTISKAISTIALAEQINARLKSKKVVPIYVIGSEDHDKEELLHCYLFGTKYEWETTQKGAIGAMKVDEGLLKELDKWIEAYGNLPFADELKSIYTASYKLGDSIAQSTQNLLRALLGNYGLIILDINTIDVKQAMKPIFERELKEKYAYNTLQANLDFLSKEYSVQAPPREINLFE